MVSRTESRLSAPKRCRELLGRPKIFPEKAARDDQVGIATGMFYTPVGGDIMFVEVSTMRGKGELVLTGQLGDVMKESARERLGATPAPTPPSSESRRFSSAERDVHIHCPAGAIPEGRTFGRRHDGDGSGIGIARQSSLGAPRSRHDR